MKNVIVFILIGMISSTVFAKNFHFVVLLGRDKFEYKIKADTWEEAYSREADSCFHFFINRAGSSITEKRGLDIIDACANPKERP